MVDYCCHMILLILLNISSPYCGDQTDNSTKGLEAKVLTAPLRVFYPLWEKGMYSIQEFGLFNHFKIIMKATELRFIVSNYSQLCNCSNLIIKVV